MKNKKILAIGLCGAICLSIAGVTYASASASDTPKVSTSETGNTSGADILYQDTDGGQISVDGKNWVAEADYEKNNAAPDVQWWTADEYEAWMNEQKKEMESLTGTGDGWYDGQGVFREFTQESVDAMMDSYKETLESIKKGVLYSKDDGDGDTYSMIPPTKDVVSFYSVDVTKDNRKTARLTRAHGTLLCAMDKQKVKFSPLVEVDRPPLDQLWGMVSLIAPQALLSGLGGLCPALRFAVGARHFLWKRGIAKCSWVIEYV